MGACLSGSGIPEEIEQKKRNRLIDAKMNTLQRAEDSKIKLLLLLVNLVNLLYLNK